MVAAFIKNALNAVLQAPFQRSQTPSLATELKKVEGGALGQGLGEFWALP